MKKRQLFFESDLSLYIGFFNLSKINEDWVVNFSINNNSYCINFQNDTFFQEVKSGDILIIEKPDKAFYI